MVTENEPDTASVGIDAETLAALREEMVRFALLQLRDAALSEDVVHEAFDAALSSGSFEGRASLRNWVYQILRNKIVDVFRERCRHPTESYSESEDEEISDQFDQRGHWKADTRPASWNSPDAELENDQFWVIFEVCVNRLSEGSARVFMMREHLGFSINEICNELGLSDSNAWVIMHRARSQLRKCLENYFVQG